jgi:hypothetical protein
MLNGSGDYFPSALDKGFPAFTGNEASYSLEYHIVRFRAAGGKNHRFGGSPNQIPHRLSGLLKPGMGMAAGTVHTGGISVDIEILYHLGFDLFV